MDNLSFDTALPAFVRLVGKYAGDDAVTSGRILFLRNAFGVLTAVLRDAMCSAIRADNNEAARCLAPYVEPEMVTATPAELYDDSLADIRHAVWETIRGEDGDGPAFAWLVDRRIVGADWMVSPLPPLDGPPVIVFASLKGGVGRSTALSVAAADFASRGMDVLVIDLDLEAPGIGAMLLDQGDCPRFGCLDYLVEGLLDPAASLAPRDLIGISAIVQGRGLVHVVPVVGTMAEKFPQNVTMKLARATLDISGPRGEAQSFLQRVRELVRRLSEERPYSAIFVDARAGLAETTAVAFLGLGADVLLFGVDTPQTFVGYRQLLSHLARFKVDVNPDNDWRRRLRFVHAKASADRDRQAELRDRAFEIFSDTIYDIEDSDPDGVFVAGVETFNFDLDDPEAPHTAWPILHHGDFLEFDPIGKPHQLRDDVYAPAFAPFLIKLRELVERGARA